MKKFLARRIKIFGRSVSLALVMGLLVVGVAFASLWFASWSATITGSSAAGPSVVITDVTCDLGGTPGAIDLCEMQSGDVLFDINNIKPNTVFTMNFKVNPNNGNDLYLSVEPLGSLPVGIAAITHSCDGTLLTAGVANPCSLVMTADAETLPPNQDFGPIVFDYIADVEP